MAVSFGLSPERAAQAASKRNGLGGDRVAVGPEEGDREGVGAGSKPPSGR